MRQLRLQDRTLTEDDVFVIAEIGSNHGGDPDLCERMICEAARAGADAVKLQKRDNRAMFTKTALAKPYENEFSYGKTYGEHRERLDWFGEAEFRRFKAVCDQLGVLFFATPFEPGSAAFLHRLGMPLWKIASCDVTNHPLVERVASYGEPIILSTGGASLRDLALLCDKLNKWNPNYAVLHCVSLYPNQDHELNLATITRYRELLDDKLIGFSSHHPGVLPLMIARSLGASIFEVHFTLNRATRGTDHGFSLEPHGLEKAVEDLQRVRTMLGQPEKSTTLDAERRGFVSKMGKGVYLKRPLPLGAVVTPEDIVIKSPAGDGLKPYEADRIIGRELIADCSTGVDLGEGMFR